MTILILLKLLDYDNYIWYVFLPESKAHNDVKEAVICTHDDYDENGEDNDYDDEDDDYDDVL